MHSLPFFLCSLILGIATATPTPTLSDSITQAHAQPRAETSAPSESKSWWNSDSKDRNIVIIVVGAVVWLIVMVIIVMILRSCGRLQEKYFYKPVQIRPASQEELSYCWETYGPKDARGQSRPGTLLEKMELWEVHGDSIRHSNDALRSGGGG